MRDNDLNTVEVRDGMRRVVLKRGALAAASNVVFHPGISAPAATHATPTASDSTLVAITSPMVGTFYSSSSPEAKAFVNVGSTVDEDTDVCIIEAMKVFNNIKAETKGTIAKILVTNGQTVEFGQPLFLVKPA
ncbi:MAG: acetyl-CoA carboxylase biotin carboxyl carrier protein [Tepidisphaeraceae bacterium]